MCSLCICPDLVYWWGSKIARVLSNSNAAHFSLFTHRLNAISYQQQNRNDVCLGNCLLSWTVVPRLRPEDWIIWPRLAWLLRRGQRTSWPCSSRNVSHDQPYHPSTRPSVLMSNSEMAVIVPETGSILDSDFEGTLGARLPNFLQSQKYLHSLRNLHRVNTTDLRLRMKYSYLPLEGMCMPTEAII